LNVTLSGAEVKVDEDELVAYRTSFSPGLRGASSCIRESNEPPRCRESYEGRDISESDIEIRLRGLLEKGKQIGGGGGGGAMVVGKKDEAQRRR
jgi:hypothetical protein